MIAILNAGLASRAGGAAERGHDITCGAVYRCETQSARANGGPSSCSNIDSDPTDESPVERRGCIA